MLEGIGTGSVIVLAWVAVLLLVSSPWARDRTTDGVRSVVSTLGATAAGLIAFDRAVDLAAVHGRWVGYGTVFGSMAVVFAVAAVIVRRLPFFAAWQAHGIRLGRVPSPKSHRPPRSQRV